MTDPDNPRQIERLNATTVAELSQYLADLEPSTVHVDTVRGLRAAEAVLNDSKEEKRLLHVVDDFRTADFSRQAGGGPEDDIANFRVQMKKVYPDRDFVRLDLSDPIFNTFYKINSLNMEPPYIFPGQHPVEFLGLSDTHENLQMVLDNNNDISEFWEWLDEGQRSMRDAATAFHFGINYVMYAMTR